MSTILSSRNLYIDSSFGVKGSPDEFELYLPDSAFTVKDGQYIRFTVQNLLGYKMFPNVNASNKYFVLQLITHIPDDPNFGEVVYTEQLSLDELSHNNVISLAKDFHNKIKQKLIELDFGNTNSNQTQDNFYMTSENSFDAGHNNIFKATLGINPKTNGEIIKSIAIFFHRVPGNTETLLQDTHLLLGGITNNNIDNVHNCMSTSIYVPGNDDIDNSRFVNLSERRIDIQGFFPMQTKTLTHVYLRSNLVNDSYQNHHFDSSKNIHDNFVTESTILCKAPIHDEFFSFDEYSGHASGYFVNCSSRSITSIRFNLTDDKDRPLPSSPNQSCQLVLRCDVIGS